MSAFLGIGLACMISSAAHAQLFAPSNVKPLNINATTDWGEDSHPQAVTDGTGHWVAVWDSRDTLGGTTGGDEDIMVARSSDNGAMWSFPEIVDANATSDTNRPDSFPEIATDAAGNWLVVWVSGEGISGQAGTDTDILMSRSTDNGATWSPAAPITADAATDTGSDITPQLATDGQGTWVVVWAWVRDQTAAINADYDMLEAHSMDNGATWSSPQILNTNGVAPDPYARLNSQPDLATDGLGTWISLWQYRDLPSVSERVTVFSVSTDNGQAWTVPAVLEAGGTLPARHQDTPQIIADGLGAWLVSWTSTGDNLDDGVDVSRSSDDGGTWSSAVPMNSDPMNDDDVWDRRPHVSADDDGILFAVWERTDSATLPRESDIAAAYSSDSGQTWSTPRMLNSNWAVDADASDLYPRVANDGGKHWLAVWQSNKDFGGNPSFEGDALVSRWPVKSGNGSGGCFVATAAYGSPLATELGSLRRFRDQQMLTNPVGSAAADLYYRVSPPAADYIAARPSLRSVVREMLDALISPLLHKGQENETAEDPEIRRGDRTQRVN